MGGAPRRRVTLRRAPPGRLAQKGRGPAALGAAPFSGRPVGGLRLGQSAPTHPGGPCQAPRRALLGLGRQVVATQTRAGREKGPSHSPFRCLPHPRCGDEASAREQLCSPSSLFARAPPSSRLSPHPHLTPQVEEISAAESHKKANIKKEDPLEVRREREGGGETKRRPARAQRKAAARKASPHPITPSFSPSPPSPPLPPHRPSATTTRTPTSAACTRTEEVSNHLEERTPTGRPPLARVL